MADLMASDPASLKALLGTSSNASALSGGAGADALMAQQHGQ
jgi:hypothetical protein